MKRLFQLTNEHLKLARRTCIYWQKNAYLGAPAVDQKRPYGNSSILEDIAEITGMELFIDANDEKHISKEQEEKCLLLHKEMETALQIILATGSFQPGLYEADRYDTLSWKIVKR